jgi:hypothetical protein
MSTASTFMQNNGLVNMQSKGAENMKWGYVLLTGMSLAFPTTAFADDCEDAVQQYNSVLSDMDSTIRRLRSCVADSKARDDCSTEFRRLKSAYDDFETAVSRYRRDCNN